MEENLTDDAGHSLVQDLTHHQVQQSLLILDKQSLVVLVPGQLVQGVGRPPQHVQAGAHALGVVAKRVDAVLLRHNHRVVLHLLDKADQEGDTRVLVGDCARHAGVGARKVVQQVDGKLAQDLVLGAVQFARQEGAELLEAGVGRRAQDQVNVSLLKRKKFEF